MKAFTCIEASLSNQVELSIGFGMREGSLRVLEDTIFSIDNEDAFRLSVSRIRDLICDYHGNPFKESMSYASSMGARVGVVYDARDDDWDTEIADDNLLPTGPEPELLQMCTISLPPFGLPPISSRRDNRNPPTDPLTQRPERDKVSESVIP